MYKRALIVTCLLLVGGPAIAQQTTPHGVKTVSPPGAIKPTGTWNLATRAGDFLNMRQIAQSEGAGLNDTVRLVVFVTDMFRFRPIVNKVQAELWGRAPYPPRTIVEVQRLNQDDIVEIEGTFYAPKLGK